MSERITVTPLGPYIGAEISGLDLTRPLSDNQFEQLYHAQLRHQVVFLRGQDITPQQQRDLARRFGDLHIHPIYPHVKEVEEIIVLDTHNDNPPDNDNWHTDVTFIDTPPAGAILAAKQLPEVGGDTLWTSGIAAWETLSAPLKALLGGLRAEHDFRKSFPEWKYRNTQEEHRRWLAAVEKNPPVLHPVVRTHPVTGRQALFVNNGFTTNCRSGGKRERGAAGLSAGARGQAGVSGTLALAGGGSGYLGQSGDAALCQRRLHAAAADHAPGDDPRRQAVLSGWLGSSSPAALPPGEGTSGGSASRPDRAQNS